jgi:hypothetical protein
MAQFEVPMDDPFEARSRIPNAETLNITLESNSLRRMRIIVLRMSLWLSATGYYYDLAGRPPPPSMGRAISWL